jgi:hypothetical protein
MHGTHAFLYAYDKSIYLDNKFRAHDRHLALRAILTQTRTCRRADNTMIIYLHYIFTYYS